MLSRIDSVRDTCLHSVESAEECIMVDRICSLRTDNYSFYNLKKFIRFYL